METFFRNYERNSSSGESGALISQFANVFMVAVPQGVKAVQADAFALALPERRKRFDEMGLQSTELQSLRESALGDQYVMVDTQWQMTFDSAEKSAEKIMVSSTFIVYTGGDQPKIVFYLPHNDVMTSLRSRGAGA